MGGGYVDAVSSGTAALFIAMITQLTFEFTYFSSVIADPGTINAIILNGLKPKLVDTEIDSYNISIKKLKKDIITSFSNPSYSFFSQIVDMSPIIRSAKQKNKSNRGLFPSTW